MKSRSLRQDRRNHTWLFVSTRMYPSMHLLLSGVVESPFFWPKKILSIRIGYWNWEIDWQISWVWEQVRLAVVHHWNQPMLISDLTSSPCQFLVCFCFVGFDRLTYCFIFHLKWLHDDVSRRYMEAKSLPTELQTLSVQVLRRPKDWMFRSIWCVFYCKYLFSIHDSTLTPLSLLVNG